MDQLASFFGFKSSPEKKKYPSSSSSSSSSPAPESSQKYYPPPPSYQQQHQYQQQQQQQQQQQPRNNKTKHNTYILVQWKQQLKPFYMNPEQYHQYTIHDIKLQCKAVFHIPIANMTILYNGGYLKDDQATLASLSIHPGSTLLVQGENVNAEQLQQIASGNEEEVGYVIRIHKVMENTRPLEIRVKALEDLQEQQSLFLLNNTNPSSSNSQSIHNNDDDEKKEDLSLYEQQQSEVIYISEMLVRSLITLDGVECPSSFATARQERRAAVHFCQDLLDRVDKLKSLYIQQQKL